MFDQFDFEIIIASLPYLMSGLVYTVKLTVVAVVGGILIGTLLALARLSSIKALSIAASIYVNVLRTIPLILVIFWIYFMAPHVLKWITNSEYIVPIGADLSAYVTFTFFIAAYYCEIIRAGIQSIPSGQISAGLALGLTHWQTMRTIVLPRAFRNMTPILLTQSIILFQDTSLVYVLGATDFLGAASKVGQRDGRLVEMYLFVALFYFITCSLLAQGVSKLQRRLSA
jgi:glutamate/aspartate transport system permease protein